jgi:hypothetical protein
MLALFLFTGATVWEGAAAAAPAGDLPDAGYYAATNSFPRNTVVDITNLENGKSIRVIVTAGLETPGLLAVLSRDAAEIIGIASRSVGRIRINQPSDPIAFSRFTEGLSSSGDPDYDPRNTAIDESVYSSSPLAASGAAFVFFPETEWADDTYREIVDLPEYYPRTEKNVAIVSMEYNEPSDFLEPAIGEAPPPVEPFVTEYFNDAAYIGKIDEDLVAPVNPVSEPEGRYDYAMLPAEERPPYRENLIDESLLIYPLGKIATPNTAIPDDQFVSSMPPPSVARESANTALQDKYYVQLGAFNKSEIADEEIARIGSAYPLIVQKSEDSEPIYRLLLGPLNIGEGGAMLQRFKSIGYKDAFLRRN